MKSERRHEIQENSLAHFLESILEGARPHGTLIGGIVLAAVLAYIGYIVLTKESTEVVNDEWSAVYSTLDASFRIGDNDVERQKIAQDFAKMSSTFGDSRPAQWAEYFYGQQNLTQASDLAFSDPASAGPDIDRALKSFQKVYDATDLPVLKVKSLWGLAEAYQLQATKEALGKAKTCYEEITVIWPDTNTARAAEQRIEQLDNAATESFYTWYRDQDFVAHATKQERASRPPLQGTVPGLNDLEAPGPGTGGFFQQPGGSTPGGTAPGTPAGGSGTGNGTLFTPGMDLNGPGSVQPKPSSFTENEKETSPEKPAEEPKGEVVKPKETKPETPATTEKPAEEPPKNEAAPMNEEAPAAEEKPAEEPKKDDAGE